MRWAIVWLAACTVQPAASGTGAVSLYSGDDNTGRTGSVSAAFPKGPPASCASHTLVASCRVSSDCPDVYAPTFAFGEIDIAGTTPGIAMPGDDYQSFSAPLFRGGDSLEVSGGGEDVPMFATTIDAPPKITVSGPATIPPTDEDLPLTWTGSGNGQVDVYLGSGSQGGPFTTIDCLFPVDDGRGTIPGAVRSMLPPSFFAGLTTTTAVSLTPSDGWTITIRVDLGAVTTDGSPGYEVL